MQILGKQVCRTYIVLKSTFARYRANNDGNFATITAVCLLAIAGMLGLAIETSEVRSAKQELQSHLDVISIAIATSGLTENEEQQTLAQELLAASGYEIDASKLTILMTEQGEVSVTGTVGDSNAFAGLLGQDTIDIKLNALIF